MPVMRAAAENRRRKRVHDTYLCLPAFTGMHKYVSPGLYGLKGNRFLISVNSMNYLKIIPTPNTNNEPIFEDKEFGNGKYRPTN